MPEQTSRLRLVAEFTDKATGGLKGLSNKMEAFGSKTEKTGQKIKKVLKPVAIGLAAVGTAAFAMKKAFDFAAEGAQLLRLEQAGEELAQGFGTSMAELVGAIQTAARGTISSTDAMGAANRAMMLGVATDSETMAQLMQVAMERGRAMGLSTQQAFDDIVTGLGRASPMILDNLGIILDSEKIYGDYAASIGKAKDELTKAEKTQALVSSTVAGAKAPTKDLAETYERLGVAFAEAADAAKKGLAEAFEPLVEWVLESVEQAAALADALDILGLTQGEANQQFGEYIVIAGRGVQTNRDWQAATIEAAEAQKKHGDAILEMTNVAGTGRIAIQQLQSASADAALETQNLANAERDVALAFGEVTSAQLAAESLDALTEAFAEGVIDEETYKSMYESIGKSMAGMDQSAINAHLALFDIQQDFATGKTNAIGYTLELVKMNTQLDILAGRGPIAFPSVSGGGVQAGGQFGLDMTVPPGFANDNFMIGASSGERVNITPTGVAGDTNITNNNQQIFPNSTINESAPGMRELVFDYIEEFMTG